MSLSNKACLPSPATTNIVDILGKVNQHSLLLLDELGHSADPQREPPAMAILEDLRLRQVKDHGDDPLSRTQGLWPGRHGRMPAWSLIRLVCTSDLSLCTGFLVEAMPLKSPNVWGLSDVVVGDASQQVNQDNDVSRIIEQEEQTLSRKRTISVNRGKASR